MSDFGLEADVTLSAVAAEVAAESRDNPDIPVDDLRAVKLAGELVGAATAVTVREFGRLASAGAALSDIVSAYFMAREAVGKHLERHGGRVHGRSVRRVENNDGTFHWEEPGR